jgi:hypothetical protein
MLRSSRMDESGRTTDSARKRCGNELQRRPISVEEYHRMLDVGILAEGEVYAEAGVPEYWVVDLMEHVVHVNRDPDRQAKRFRITTVTRAPESLACASLQAEMFPLTEILG